MKSVTTLHRAALVSAIAFGAVSASAFPIAPLGTEGILVIASSINSIVATYEGNSASYSNDLYLALDGVGVPGDDGDTSNDLFIFNNHTSPIGSSVDLGTFPIGTELLFRLHVNNTGYDYFSGPGSRNPDGKPHARVQDGWATDTTLVSFEDLFDTPEFPGGYNDLSFSFTNTRGLPVVPEASTVISGIGLAGLAGLAVYRRRRA